MKYKIGDKVRIKSDLNLKIRGVVPEMINIKDQILTVLNVRSNTYDVKESLYGWTDEMIEGLVEEEKHPIDYIDDIKVDVNKEAEDKQYHEDLMRISTSILQGIVNKESFLKAEDFKPEESIEMYISRRVRDSIYIAKEHLTQLKLEQK